MFTPVISRREFIKATTGTSAALSLHALGQTDVAPSSKMIGIQVGAISFVDEGIEKVLDTVQELACVNTLFLAVFTYGRGIAGRQIRRTCVSSNVHILSWIEQQGRRAWTRHRHET